MAVDEVEDFEEAFAGAGVVLTETLGAPLAPRRGTAGTTKLDDAFAALFRAEAFFAVLRTGDFLTALFAVFFFAADFLATDFLAEVFLAVFLTADFFTDFFFAADFLAVDFFTATITPWFECVLSAKAHL